MSGKDSRVNFATAEALAFGTLAIHRGIGSKGQEFRATEGLNKGAYGVIIPNLNSIVRHSVQLLF